MKSMVFISTPYVARNRTPLQRSVRDAEQLDAALSHDQVILHLYRTDPRQADAGLDAECHAWSERFLLTLQIRPLQRRGQSHPVADAMGQSIPRLGRDQRRDLLEPPARHAGPRFINHPLP